MHTVVLSDMHLSEAQPPEPRRPLWMAYKRREHFIDGDFARLLAHVAQVAAAGGPDERVELVLNGDVFDFDSVVQLPAGPRPSVPLAPGGRSGGSRLRRRAADGTSEPPLSARQRHSVTPPDDSVGKVDWLARLRGLGSENWMSCFKMRCIIADHPVWFAALRDFIGQGHRAVFVAGNHDVELCWPDVQGLIRQALGVDDDDLRVTFCNWFYLSGEDTYISHGHQYDPNCVVANAIDPLIEVRGRPRMRIPFGDLAARYMLNGMGYFNPNATDNYIMSGRQYVKFFFRYMLLTQPLLLWTWFWGALVTLYVSLRDHLKPSMRDPLRVDDKVSDIAARSNVTASQVRQLAALSVPSASGQPLRIMRELWLDRGFLFIGIALLAWQIMLHINIALPISPLWAFAALALLLPPYLVYASSVKAKVFDEPLLNERRARLVAAITGACTVVFGHTHKPVDRMLAGVRYLNGGFWSPAFAEPECKTRVGTQSFVWIKPTSGKTRAAALFEWPPGQQAPRPLHLKSAAAQPPAGAVPSTSTS